MANAVTSFVIDPHMLPDGIGEPFVVGKTAFVQLAL